MQLHFIDWAIIAAFLLVSLLVGLKFRARASKSLSDFFLGGRNLPWYIAGISMVATTFAADTPLAVTELVANNGISGNWLWWNMLFGGMLTTFFFARLWRRANILTELELIELRYSGVEAAFLRGFKSVYMGLFMNTLIIGWVNVAMISILTVFFDIPESEVLWYAGGAMLIAASYSVLSGLWGVAITDVIQFVIAMTGCIVLAVLVVSSDKIGGIEGLKEQLPKEALSFFPTLKNASATDVVSTLSLSVFAFLAYVSVQWWASWYPGAEPGGGGYIAQRMMSTKNERHSIFATLFFQIAHYCIRPWPWIIVGLCCLILYPDLGVDDKKLGYVMAMKDFLPIGLKGLLIVAFLAAYMSTISTQLNWGASYLTNDLYKRFIRPESSFSNPGTVQQHYVYAGRIFTVLIMLVSLYTTSVITTISGVWHFIIECGAGLGLVLILRWYWERINAWSEISATLAPFFLYWLGNYHLGLEFPWSYFLTVGGTTVTWLAVTFLTKPVKTDTLLKFCEVVKPSGWWPSYSSEDDADQRSKRGNVAMLGLTWIFAIVMTYSILFLTGYVILQEWTAALVCFITALSSFLAMRKMIALTGIFED